ADEDLIVAVVSDRLAGGLDAARERRVGDDPPLPDRVEQLVLAYRPVVIANEVDEQVEHLRLDRDDLAASAPLMVAEIDLVLGEAEVQMSPLGMRGRRFTRRIDPKRAARIASNYHIQEISGKSPKEFRSPSRCSASLLCGMRLDNAPTCCRTEAHPHRSAANPQPPRRHQRRTC